jgi:hypothetical protein
MKRFTGILVLAMVALVGALATAQPQLVKNYFTPCATVGAGCDNALKLGGSVVADGSEIVLTNVDLDTTDNSVGAGLCENQSVTATGVVATDNLVVTMTSTDLNVAFAIGRAVPGTDAVTLGVCNNSAGALDPGAVADFRIWRVQ